MSPCRASSCHRQRAKSPPSRTMAGNVSRSIDTRTPSGIRSSTDGSRTYVPALISLVGTSSRGGFSTKALTASIVVSRHHAEGGGVGHRVKSDGALSPALAVKGHEGRQIEIREHIPVDDHEVSSTPANAAAKRTAPAVSSGSDSTA